MKRTLLISALLLAHAAPVYAQWQFSAGAAVRHFRMAEYGTDGRSLVTEQGWLPGVRLAVERSFGDWRVGVQGERFQGRLDYDGQVQAGSAFTSDADAAQTRIGVEMARAITENTELLGGVEYDLWRRRVHGQGAVAGLTERYGSWRLLAGAGARLPFLPGQQSRLRVMLVAAQAERLEVQFDNRLFDDARFSTKPAIGARIGMSLQPGAESKLLLSAELEWMKVRRSDDAPLTKGGFVSGAVSQPEHTKTGLTLGLHYRF